MGGSILVVEDELVTQRLIAASLERAGYKVTRARSLGVVPRLPGAGPSCASSVGDAAVAGSNAQPGTGNSERLLCRGPNGRVGIWRLFRYRGGSPELRDTPDLLIFSASRVSTVETRSCRRSRCQSTARPFGGSIPFLRHLYPVPEADHWGLHRSGNQR